MARYRVLRRRISQEEYECLSRHYRSNHPQHETLVYVPQINSFWGWLDISSDEVYLTRDKAETRIFAEKAAEELVVSEYTTKDDPLYQVTNVVES